MTRLIFATAALLCAAAIAAGPVLAQGQTPSRPPDPGLSSTLKVTVVLSRINGQKKIASLPFVLLMTPTEERTSVQMSSNVPVPTTSVVQGDGKTSTAQSFSYQSLGTNLQASAKELSNGQYAVSLTINDSQILTDTGSAMLPDSTKGLFKTQSFTSTVRLPLKDAQTISYDAATDKLTGDIVRVEVTLNIVK